MDLVTTKQYFFILSEISSATCHTKLKSASSSNLLVGVPTVIKKISVFSELFFMLEAKDNNFVLLICLSKSLFIKEKAIKDYINVTNYLEKEFPKIELNGHDLNLENLKFFLDKINNIKEVSIGHLYL